MPKDKRGNFHLNTQRAMAADKMADPPASHGDTPAPMPNAGMGDMADMPHHKVYDHGDGSYHTESPDGQQHDHDNIEALKEHFDRFMGEEMGEGQEPMSDEKAEHGEMEPMHMKGY